MLLAIVTFVGAAASSCTPGQAVLSRKAHNARENLVGISRADVLSCAGKPGDIKKTGSWETLSYVSGEPALGSDHTRCVVSFTLVRGYVETIAYLSPNGNLIGRSIPECLDVVGPCLPPEPVED